MTEPERIVRRWFEEVWNQAREAAIDELLAADAVEHGIEDRPVCGPEEFRRVFRTFHGAFPGLRVEIVRTIVEGELAAAHCHVRGRHTGAALGGAPTDRQVDFWGVAIVRVRDGRIVEGWNCFDLLRMYDQLGWVS